MELLSYLGKLASDRKRTLGKHVSQQWLHGFESLPFRQDNFYRHDPSDSDKAVI